MAFRAQIQTRHSSLSWICSQVRLSPIADSISLSAFPSSFPRPSTSLSLPLSPPPRFQLRFAVVGAQDRHRSQPEPQRLHRYCDHYYNCYGHYQHRHQRQRGVDPRLSKPLIPAVSASNPIRIAQAQSQAATPSPPRSNKLRFPLSPRVGFVSSNPATPHLRLSRRCFSSSSISATMTVGTVLVTGYDPSLYLLSRDFPSISIPLLLLLRPIAKGVALLCALRLHNICDAT